MDIDLVVRWAHVLGAAVLFGTGAGIAFFMVMAHRSGDVKVIAGTARTVVIGDFLFTATAVVLQPVTGLCPIPRPQCPLVMTGLACSGVPIQLVLWSQRLTLHPTSAEPVPPPKSIHANRESCEYDQYSH